MIVANRKDMFEFFVDKKWDTNVVFDIEVSNSQQYIAMWRLQEELRWWNEGANGGSKGCDGEEV